MIKIGIIGYGYWGPNLARNFAELPSADLRMIGDLSEKARTAAALRHPGATVCSSIDDVIGKTDIDAVVIATPVSTHFDMALAALRSGKHVLVEKPMTETSAGAERLIEEAEKRNLILMVDHTFVFSGAIRTIKTLLSEGQLGDVFYYDSVRINLGLYQRDVDVIWDLATHDLSILSHLFEAPPLSVTANASSHINPSLCDVAYISLTYPSGTVAHLNVSWLAPVKVRRTLIGGSRKMIIYDDLDPSEKVKVYDRGVVRSSDPGEIHDMRIGYRIGDMWAPRLDTTEALARVADHFVRCIDTAATPITGGEQGLHVVRLLEATARSAANSGRPTGIVG